MKLIILALLLTLVTGCSSQSNEQNKTVSPAKAALFKACPEMATYASDFTHTTETTENEQQHWKWVVRDHGWIEWTAFVFTVSNQPKKIPKSYYAQGHNLFYYVSTTDNPGIDVGKKTAGQFCGKGRFNGFIAHR